MGTAALIANRQGEFLLHLRDQIEGICWPGYWGFIGGRPEDGETAREAIVRELDEEAGLSIPDLRPLAVMDQGIDGKAKIEVFAGHWDGDPRDLQLTEGVMLHWFPHSTLDRLRIAPWCVEAIHLYQRGTGR
jgi:8-oxo-dGTP pyrophosphatase MutT (NUDIX family)